MTTYLLQYNDGSLSMIVKDDKETIREVAKVLSNNKKKYPVAIITVKMKAGEKAALGVEN